MFRNVIIQFLDGKECLLCDQAFGEEQAIHLVRCAGIDVTDAYADYDDGCGIPDVPWYVQVNVDCPWF